MLRLTRNILQRLVNDFRAELHAHLQRLSLAFHSRREVGDLLYSLTTDTCAIQTLAMDGVFSVLSSVALLDGMVVVLLQLDWQLIAAMPPRSTLPEATRREPLWESLSWPLRVVAAHWGRRALRL